MTSPNPNAAPLQKWMETMHERHKQQEDLLQSIKSHLEELETILPPNQPHWIGEDSFYRFYHQSLKVYSLQQKTEKIFQLFEKIGKKAGLHPLNPYFSKILKEGTGKTFTLEHNDRWLEETRPIVEAFLHAREFLHLHILYAKKLQEAPPSLPSGWAAVLYLYNVR